MVAEVGIGRVLREHTAQVNSIDFSHDGELLATADAQGRVKIWRLSQELSTMAPHEREQLSEFVLARGPGGGESIEEEEAHGEGGSLMERHADKSTLDSEQICVKIKGK